MAQQLTAGMQHIEAIFAHTMDVIALFRETTFLECARFVFEELFETVACQLFVFDVIGFMFLCDEWTKIGLRVECVNDERKGAHNGRGGSNRTRLNSAYSPISALFLNV